MAIRTIYENVKSDFYAVERGGYVTVSTAIYDTVTDLLNHGFTLSSVKYTDASGVLTNGEWPIVEPVFTMVDSGTGYKGGEVLEMQGGTFASSPLKLSVTTVDAITGAVLTFKVTNHGDYTIPPDSPAVLYPAITDTKFVSSFTALNSIVEAGNVPPTTGTYTSEIPNAYANIPGTFNVPASTTYVSALSISPENVAYRLDIPNTRQPTTVLYMTGVAPATLKVGQEIFGPGIPLGTTIVAMRAFQLITSTSYVGKLTGGLLVGGTPPVSAATVSYRETTVPATYFIFSQPVTITSGDVVYSRGNGMTIDNTATQLPSKWSVIVEAGASVDPLNDDVGIYGNVTALTSDSIYVEVGSLVGTKIYPGQLVVSTVEPDLNTGIGGSVSGVTTVVAVTSNIITNTSNVTLSSSQTFNIADEMLHFIFAELQPWRLAFDVFSPQQVAIYAATPIQLTDTGNIAKVTNDRGQVIDTAGAMGSMPTGGPTVTTRGSDIVDGRVYAINNAKVPGSVQQPGQWDYLTKWTDWISKTEISNITNYEVSGSQEYFVADRSTYVDPTANANGAQYSKGYGTARHLDGTPWDGDVTQGFVNRTIRVGQHPQAYPLNYAITISDHGLFFGMWEGTWSSLHRTKNASRDNYFNWLVIQRPVNRFTGQTLTAGRSPVFCVNCVGYKYWKFIVREADILHPSQGDQQLQSSVFDSTLAAPVTQITPFRVPADQHSEDSFAVINTSNQLALTEDSTYLVGFLHNLSTPRFRYSEELDMVGQTSADVCMSSNDIMLTTYNESGPRTYIAMPSNNKYNSGLRICILKDTPN